MKEIYQHNSSTKTENITFNINLSGIKFLLIFLLIFFINIFIVNINWNRFKILFFSYLIHSQHELKHISNEISSDNNSNKSNEISSDDDSDESYEISSDNNSDELYEISSDNDSDESNEISSDNDDNNGINSNNIIPTNNIDLREMSEFIPWYD